MQYVNEQVRSLHEPLPKKQDSIDRASPEGKQDLPWLQDLRLYTRLFIFKFYSI